jgi:hypothetical protein
VSRRLVFTAEALSLRKETLEMNEKPNPESAEEAEALRHGADSREPGLLESAYGLLINFNVPVLKNGLKRMVNNYSESGAERIVSASSANQLREDKSSDSLVSSLRSSPRPGDSAVNSRPQ